MPVLLVDDNPLMQQVISRFLMSQGYTVDVASDAQEALEFARRRVYRLLMIDMRLPDADGPHLLRRLRALPGFADCPAIAVSGLGEDDREQTVDAGFETFLAKPIDLDELLATVYRYAGTPTVRALGK
jgi:two-component system, cell cycle response regulator DivK